MGFITILHHHLGEYVWNFFQASNMQMQENDTKGSFLDYSIEYYICI